MESICKDPKRIWTGSEKIRKSLSGFGKDLERILKTKLDEIWIGVGKDLENIWTGPGEGLERVLGIFI